MQAKSNLNKCISYIELDPVICTQGLSETVTLVRFVKFESAETSLRSVMLFLPNVKNSSDVGKYFSH